MAQLKPEPESERRTAQADLNLRLGRARALAGSGDERFATQSASVFPHPVLASLFESATAFESAPSLLRDVQCTFNLFPFPFPFPLRLSRGELTRSSLSLNPAP